MTRARDELVIGLLASLLEGAGVVACGSSSPLQAAAALLAEALFPGQVRALIFRNNVDDPFHESGSELYDRLSQGRIDVFFLSSGQIDGSANLNNVGIGGYAQPRVRLPGAFGTPFIYLMAPRVILYREKHDPSTLVERVDFVSAPGVTPPDVHRRGGPSDLVTSRAHFTFDRGRGRFRLRSLHPGEDVAGIVAQTGFSFDQDPVPVATARPSAEWLALLHGPVRERLSQTYPEFARSRLGDGR